MVIMEALLSDNFLMLSDNWLMELSMSRRRLLRSSRVADGSSSSDSGSTGAVSFSLLLERRSGAMVERGSVAVAVGAQLLVWFGLVWFGDAIKAVAATI
jgi:hypothetical protein